MTMTRKVGTNAQRPICPDPTHAYTYPTQEELRRKAEIAKARSDALIEKICGITGMGTAPSSDPFPMIHTSAKVINADDLPQNTTPGDIVDAAIEIEALRRAGCRVTVSVSVEGAYTVRIQWKDSSAFNGGVTLLDALRSAKGDRAVTLLSANQELVHGMAHEAWSRFTAQESPWFGKTQITRVISTAHFLAIARLNGYVFATEGTAEVNAARHILARCPGLVRTGEDTWFILPGDIHRYREMDTGCTSDAQQATCLGSDSTPAADVKG